MMTVPDRSTFFTTADELGKRLHEPGLKIVDASWYLPAQNRNARGEYDTAHIPGAVFFDQDLVVEPGVNLPHALPSPRVFARHAGAMGIGARDAIVVHDGPGLFSAPRVWWLFKTFGASNVRILEGGMDSWTREGRPVTVEPTKIAPCFFQADFNPEHLVAFDEMRAIVENAAAQIVDARSTGRFTGAEPEPRPGMRSGHMPGARNVPALSLARDGILLDPAGVRAAFEQAGVDMDKPVVTSCGSGVTAATLILALESIGKSGNRLYDGSWAEWGGRADTPVATGSG
jgi:thiosulfate/3-mercaptopyruvate sulfurtransferase